MKEESATIILPLPSRYLSPNYKPWSKGGAIAKARAASQYRTVAKKATVECGVSSGPWQKVRVFPVFYHKVNRRRDDVNHAQMLKSAFDGIVDAGLVIDDSMEHWATQPVRFEIDKAFPRVEITVVRVG